MQRPRWTRSAKDMLTRKVIALLARGMTIPEIMMEVSYETKPDQHGIERPNKGRILNPQTGKPYHINTLWKIERDQRDIWEAESADLFRRMKAEAMSVSVEIRRSAWAHGDLRAALVANDQILKMIQGYMPIRVDNRVLDIPYESLTNEQLVALRDGEDVEVVLAMVAREPELE